MFKVVQTEPSKWGVFYEDQDRAIGYRDSLKEAEDLCDDANEWYYESCWWGI